MTVVEIIPVILTLSLSKGKNPRISLEVPMHYNGEKLL
jgi:hypothetical protein